MIKVYYRTMRNTPLIVLFLAAPLLAAGVALAQQASSQKTASLESHEGVTLSAQPWTDPALYKGKFAKKTPFSAGILAIQVTFRNDSNESLKINLDRIRLLVTISEDNHQQLEPLSAEDVADLTLKTNGKDPTATRKRIPLPGSKPKTGRGKDWSELERTASDAGVPSSVVAPHSAVQGLLYFDLQGQFDLLSTARLYVPEVDVMGKNRALTYFEIDLSQPAIR
jgi:hypothetical protein